MKLPVEAGSRERLPSAPLQTTALDSSQPEFSQGSVDKASAARATACLRFNEHNQYSDICVSIINLLLLVQLFGTELISRALYQSFDHQTCRWFPSLLPSVPRAAFPVAIPSWASILQELRSASGLGFGTLLHFVVRQCFMLHICHQVALHAAVIVLACTAPATYVRRWRCPLMLLRRLLMPLTNLLVALAAEPSQPLAYELLGDNRLVSTTIEVGLQTVMYPVPFVWHILATTARIAIQAALITRLAPIYRHDPLTILLQLAGSFVLPSALVYLTQYTLVASAPARPPPGSSKLAPPASAAPPALPPSATMVPPPVVPRIVLPTTANVAAAAAAAAAATGDDATDVAVAQRKQRRPPPRQRSLLAASETDSLVSPREAAAAAAAAAAGAAEVASDAQRHSARPPARRQRSMYKPRIRPALLISVKMHHSPDVNFDNLAPALRHSALRALHKYDCDSILAPGATTSTAGPSTSAAAPPAPALSPLQVQSACIPGCVQLLLGAWGPAAEEREGWLAVGAERGLAEALYRGVKESPEGALLGRVVVQVGAVGFTFEDGCLLEEGQAEEQEEAAGSSRQRAAAEEAALQWVWPAWVPEGSGDVEFQCGSCAEAASLAGRTVRVVVAEGAEGRVLLDRDGVVAGNDGIVRFTMPVPPNAAACRVFLLDPSAALLLSAPLLALPPACCAELSEAHACILADGITPNTQPTPTPLPPAIAALLPLLPPLTDLATGLLAHTPATTPTRTPDPTTSGPPCDPSAAAVEAAAILTHLADYFYDNDLLSCHELATACAAHLQHLALTQPPTPRSSPPSPTPPAITTSSPTTSHSASPAEPLKPQPTPAAATTADPSPFGRTASAPTDPPTKPAPPEAPSATPAAPPADRRLGNIWGFADAATREQYQQYKAVHATHVTDCLMGVSCAVSLAASVMFRSSLWQLWLAVDLVKVLQFALLLSGARPALWRWRDTIVCGTRTATALALAAATHTGVVPPGNRSRLSLGLECHVVMLVCGILRPLLYQVSLSPSMLLAITSEALYAMFVYTPICGLAPTAARCSIGTALGIIVSLALDLRCRLQYLQLASTLSATPSTLHPHVPACAAAAPATLLGEAPAQAKIKAC